CQKLAKQGYCGLEFTDRTGNRQEFKIATYRVNGKPVTTLGSILVASWIIRYHTEANDYTWDRRVQSLALSTGKNRDAGKLINHGYKELFQISLGGEQPQVIRTSLV